MVEMKQDHKYKQIFPKKKKGKKRRKQEQSKWNKQLAKWWIQKKQYY